MRRTLLRACAVALCHVAACDGAAKPPSATDDPFVDTDNAVDTDASSETAVQDTDDVTPSPVEHPNFIVIMGEARGWTSTSTQLDPMIPGSKSEIFLTPSLDTLATQGIAFSRFYSASPRCTPSRAATLTGKSPAQLHMTFVGEGARDGAVTGDVLPPDPITSLPLEEITIAELLKGEGYATAHFGKWHLGNRDPSEHGFDESDGPTTNKGPAGEDHPNPTEAFGTADRGIDFMTRAAAAHKPFYLHISHYGGGDAIDSLPASYAAETARLAGQKEPDIADAAVIRDMDVTIGELIDAVHDLGLDDTTYIVFTADHGRAGKTANAPLTQGKGSTWEGGILVPLIVRGPGIRAGENTSVFASQVDLFPTMAALAHVQAPLPADLEGGDLWGLLSSATDVVTRPRDEFVVHFPHYDKDPLGPSSAIVLGDEKLIRFYEDDSLRLFNLADDLVEADDLAPTQASRAAALEARMDAYLSDVNAQMPGHL